MGIYEHRQAKKRQLKKRIAILTSIVILVFAILIGRLFIMQVAGAEDFVNVAENNKIRTIYVPARRGMIFDKDMKIMASSSPSINFSIIQTEVQDEETLANNLAALFNDPEITKESILKDMKNEYKSYAPLVINSLSYDEGIVLAQIIAEKQEDFIGVTTYEEPTRNYPKGDSLGQVLGNVGRINENEYSELKAHGYRVTDWIGKTGLEKQYETLIIDGKNIGLRGDYGIERVEVDAKSRTVRTISSKSPIPGDSLVLTVDSKLQKVMENSLKKVINISRNSKSKGGAGVLLDIKTGAVLAMASYPLMNPNDFVEGLSKSDVKYYFDEKKRPMVNRAIASNYAPGSTFKLVSASAIVHSGISPNASVYCSPKNWIKPLASCPDPHGAVNLYSATAKSCNYYFQVMSKKAGAENLISMGKLYGFGQKTGIDLPGEVSGTLPTIDWKAKKFSGSEGRWQNYDTFYMSIGQGYNSDTVIQLANYMATVANDGVRMSPYIVDKIMSPDGVTLHSATPKVVASTGLTAEETKAVKGAMGAVTSLGGTAYKLFKDFPKSIKVGAKTGTAQTGIAGDNKNSDYHGLFVAIAPLDDPQVAFAGIVEYGTSGSGSAGIVARDVFREYFGLKYSDDDIGLIQLDSGE